MYRGLGQVELKSGERVEMGVVKAPDADWAESVGKMLLHKGDPWDWQNLELLRHDVGVDARFYILHRGDAPFANIMTVESAPMGMLGHVWTEPGDRRKGAGSLLMEAVMADFRGRGGQALFLGTEFDTPPYHIYRGFGFEGVEPGSDYMTYYAESREAFDAAWFGESEAVVEPLGWKHWPASPPLFVGDFPGRVRCAPYGILGRISSEKGVLQAIQAGRDGREVPAAALRSLRTNAVLGLAAWAEDPLWPGTTVVDVYCHPRRWDRAGELLDALKRPAARRCVAYCDEGFAEKRAALEAWGFKQVAMLPRRLAADPLGTDYLDVAVLEKG